MVAVHTKDPTFERLIGLAQRDPKEFSKRVQAAWCERPGGLRKYIELMWHAVEPVRKFVPGFHIDCICDHLEAVNRGEIKRLIFNVPPGSAKSLIMNVFFPSYQWGPARQPHLRYLCFSYSQHLTVRDNTKFRNMILSPTYRELWGDVFGPSPDVFSLIKVGNDKLGVKVASSISGVGTGERGDLLLVDDPNSVKEVDSETVRETANQWWSEVVPTRLNSQTESSIILIQQRCHAQDVTGYTLDRGMDFEHVVIPMEYDSSRRYYTSIGWVDPRGIDPDTGEEVDNDGALMWPAMFPESACIRLKRDLGPVAWAGQMNQMPVPRGGSIFETKYWNPWPDPTPTSAAKWLTADGKIKFPDLEYTVASVDTAFTQNEENDYSAMTIWGVFRDTGVRMASMGARYAESDAVEFMRLVHDQRPKVILLYAWQKRLQLHGPPEHKPAHISDQEWNSPEWLLERQQSWGLVEWVYHTCRKYRVDHLLIETAAQGHNLENELRTLHSNAPWGVEMIITRGGRGAPTKISRAWAIQHLFTNGVIYAPQDPKTGLYPQWADQVVNTMALFPRDKHDDIVDSCLAPDTEIITSKGIRRIDQIAAGDLVMTHKGRWRPVTSVASRKTSSYRRIKAKGLDEVRVTDEHPFWVGNVRMTQTRPYRRGCGGVAWVPASLVEPRPFVYRERDGKMVRNVRRVAHDSLLVPVPKEIQGRGHLDVLDWNLYDTQVRADDVWVYRRYLQAGQIDPETVSAVASEPESETNISSLARKYGLSIPTVTAIRRGVHASNPRESKVRRFIPLDSETGWVMGLFVAEGCVGKEDCSINWSCDEAAIKRVTEWIRKYVGRDPKPRFSSAAWHVGVVSQVLAPIFREFGYLAPNKIVPAWAFEAPNDFAQGFVDGYAHGDGYTAPSGHVSLTSTSKSLLWGIRLLLARLGRPAWTGATKEAGIRRVFTWESECLAAYRLDYWDKESTRALVTPDFVGTHVERNDQEFGEIEVFNLSVAQDESYLTTGGVVHNCIFALQHLRDSGILVRGDEYDSDAASELWLPPQNKPLYDV